MLPDELAAILFLHGNIIFLNLSQRRNTVQAINTPQISH